MRGYLENERSSSFVDLQLPRESLEDFSKMLFERVLQQKVTTGVHMRINLNERQLSGIFFLIASGIGISLSIGGQIFWAWLILFLSSALYLSAASDVFRRLAARNPRAAYGSPLNEGWNHMRLSIIVVENFCRWLPFSVMFLLYGGVLAFNNSKADSASLKGLRADVDNLGALVVLCFILILMLFSIVGTLATEFKKLTEVHITTQVQIAENLAQQRNVDDVIL